MLKDLVVEAVRKDLLQRSELGIKKYNTTLDRNDLTLKEWFQHTYEETLDSANYLKKIILSIEDEELWRMNMMDLCERYPNDTELGTHIRHMFGGKY